MCVGGLPLKPMRVGACIIGRPGPCRLQWFWTFWQPQSLWIRDVGMHSACPCNEMVALRNRVLQAVPGTDNSVLPQCYEVARRISAYLGRPVPWDPDEWIGRYSGNKRANYERAKADLEVRPFRRGDRMVSAFVKLEKLFDLQKDPRLIQCRGPRFNLTLGNYLKPLEHKLYGLKGTGGLGKWLPPGRLVAKGLDMRRRAELLRDAWEAVPGAIALSLDCTRFDAHVSLEMLRVEHAVYRGCYPGDRLLDRLLRLQEVNVGVTASGLRYRCPGGRMSGDMNTALGNCVLMIIMVAVAMRNVGYLPRQWRMVDDGDDCILVVPRGFDVARFEREFSRFGHVLKVEQVATRLVDIEFCQSHAIHTAHGLKMVQNPVRTLSRAMAGPRHWNCPKFRARYLGLLGWCELAICMGVPVLQSFAMLMIRSSGGKLPKKWTYCDRVAFAMREAKRHSVEPIEVTLEARVDFWEAFGMSPDEQRALENQFDTSILSWDGSQEADGPIPGAGPPPTPGEDCSCCPQEGAQRRKPRGWDRLVSGVQWDSACRLGSGFLASIPTPPISLSRHAVCNRMRALHSSTGAFLAV